MELNSLVMVKWMDANFERGELRPVDMNPLAELRSVGWLVRNDPESVSVSAEQCEEDGSYRETTHIPKGCVKTVTLLSTGLEQDLQAFLEQEK